MNGKIISAVVALGLASVACGFSVNLPGQAKTGPEVKETITVPDPKSDKTHLTLSFGAGNLTLSPGAQNLVDGTAVYNVKDLKPEVTSRDGEVEIKQGDFGSIPPFDGMKNEWDLNLGKSPMDLTVEAGAYKGELELGGLALKNLTVKDGASEVKLSFSKPNLVEMSEFSYTTGASDVTLEGLANANFKTLVFNSGAGNYNLDFSGNLQQDAIVSIDSGFSDLTLIIPQGLNAVVTVDSAVADVNFGNGWSQKGNAYTQKGQGPTLTIIINVGAGNITIKDS